MPDTGRAAANEPITGRPRRGRSPRALRGRSRLGDRGGPRLGRSRFDGRVQDCLRQPAAWYAGADARRVADNVMRYQRDSGGWPKNLDMAAPLTPADLDRWRRRVRNLTARSTTARPRPNCAFWRVSSRPRPGRSSARRGCAGSIICFGASIPAAAGLRSGPSPADTRAHHVQRPGHGERAGSVAGSGGARRRFGFLDAARRESAEAAVARGVACILRCQVIVGAKRTVWCAQHDRITFEPAAARAYEHPSLSGARAWASCGF